MRPVFPFILYMCVPKCDSQTPVGGPIQGLDTIRAVKDDVSLLMLGELRVSHVSARTTNFTVLILRMKRMGSVLGQPC